MKPFAPRPPLPLAVGSLLTAAVGLGILGLAGLSLASGHGQFSTGIAAALLLYGLALVAAAFGLWRRSRFARGPVVAASIMHAAVAWGALGQQPWAWVLLASAVVTMVVMVLPATTDALGFGTDRPEAD